MARYSNPFSQYSSGNVALAGGKLFFFITGTSTPKDTFSDVDRTVPNTNPVLLDANGVIPAIFLSEDSLYKVILQDKDGVQKDETDNVGEVPPEGQFSDWDATTNYVTGDLVKGSNGAYYIALQASINQNPTTQPTFWTKIDLIRFWNTEETYSIEDVVIDAGIMYRSLANSNKGNNPATDLTNWALVWVVGAGLTVATGGTVTLDTSSTRNTDHASVTLTAGAGLTGGGDITASRTFDVGAGDGIIVNADDVALDGFALTSHGLITSTTTVDGEDIASVSSSGAGVYALVYTTAASATDKQATVATPDGSSSFAITQDNTSTTGVTVRQWLLSGSSQTPFNQFPVAVHRTTF